MVYLFGLTAQMGPRPTLESTWQVAPQTRAGLWDVPEVNTLFNCVRFKTPLVCVMWWFPVKVYILID
jgi:hypothetical protein